MTDDLLSRLDAAIGGPDRRTKTGRVRKLTPMKIETKLLIDAKAEIERLHGEYADLDALRHTACEQRDRYKTRLKQWMLDLPDDKDAEIERLRSALEAIAGSPGADNETAYKMRKIAREALDAHQD